ncbi:MAG TPA: tetratricopeptide repeat protein [Myxococcales bacterium]|nr:tetratricopeptide repeat protein [Myxococcales bacterium]
MSVLAGPSILLPVWRGPLQPGRHLLEHGTRGRRAGDLRQGARARPEAPRGRGGAQQPGRHAARAHFEAALAAAPANLESRYNAALLYLDKGRNDEAIALLEQAAQLEPNHEPVNLRLGLAVLHARAEQPEPAGLLLAEALALGGDDARAFAGGFPILAPLLGD